MLIILYLQNIVFINTKKLKMVVENDKWSWMINDLKYSIIGKDYEYVCALLMIIKCSFVQLHCFIWKLNRQKGFLHDPSLSSPFSLFACMCVLPFSNTLSLWYNGRGLHLISGWPMPGSQAPVWGWIGREGGSSGRCFGDRWALDYNGGHSQGWKITTTDALKINNPIFNDKRQDDELILFYNI